MEQPNLFTCNLGVWTVPKQNLLCFTIVTSINQKMKVWCSYKSVLSSCCTTHVTCQTTVGIWGLCLSFFSFCRAEYSYSGAASFVTARNKHCKTVNSLHKEPGMPSRQFGRNAYVWNWTVVTWLDCRIYHKSLWHQKLTFCKLYKSVIQLIVYIFYWF